MMAFFDRIRSWFPSRNREPEPNTLAHALARLEHPKSKPGMPVGGVAFTLRHLVEGCPNHRGYRGVRRPRIATCEPCRDLYAARRWYDEQVRNWAPLFDDDSLPFSSVDQSIQGDGAPNLLYPRGWTDLPELIRTLGLAKDPVEVSIPTRRPETLRRLIYETFGASVESETLGNGREYDALFHVRGLGFPRSTHIVRIMRPGNEPSPPMPDQIVLLDELDPDPAEKAAA